MTLKEKFENKIFDYVGSEFDRRDVSNNCVAVANNYAENFGKWLKENDDEDLLMSELLEIFIKENGL